MVESATAAPTMVCALILSFPKRAPCVCSFSVHFRLGIARSAQSHAFAPCDSGMRARKPGKGVERVWLALVVPATGTARASLAWTW